MTNANDPSFSPPPQGPAAKGDNPPAPDPSTGIQAGAPARSAATAIQAAGSETSIPLPPAPPALRKQTSPEQLARELARLDWGLISVTLALAFLLASFAVRNSDFWMHLASGRLLAHGQYAFGVDPFTYTSTGRYWANNSWLADLILYGLASLGGGPESPVGGAVLVIAKALLVTALAWVMLQIRRPGQSLWAPAACTALALVAMSPRLLLQPTLISLLFLALTLYLLQYPHHEEGRDRRQERGTRSPLAVYWLLPPLFVLWVNLDSWFFLGPVTVALYLLGQTLQQFTMPIRTGADAPEPRQPITLLLVLLVGLVATLLNPHHYHAWTPPYEFTPVEVLQQDNLLKGFFVKEYFYRLLQEGYSSGQDWNLAALAYYPLIVLGLTSFVLSFFAGFRWWRLLVWLPFAILSFPQLRTVAFLAVVTGPIAALNLQDYCAATFGREPRVERGWKLWSLGGRVITLVLGLALLVAAWPGWLHARLGEARASELRQRRASWTVEVDPSLRLTAAHIRDCRLKGWLQPDDHGFNYVPDIVNYCAWFCAAENGLPLEKGFYDYRLSLFPEDVTADYVGLRQTFNPAQAGDSSGRSVKWPAIFRKQGINHIVLNNNDPAAVQVGRRLLADWQQWTLLYMDGRSTIFRWNDPRLLRERRHQAQAESSPGERFDPNPLAFGPRAIADRVPSEGPGRAASPQPWWALWFEAPAAHSLDGDKAVSYLNYYLVMSQVWSGPYLASQEWASWAGTTGLVATSPASGTLAAPLTLALTPFRTGRLSPTPLLRGTDLGPAAMPLLAVRAARRAIATSPDDAQAYFALAQAYETLWTMQEEYWASRQPRLQMLFPRQKLRQVQLTTALEYGLRGQPDDEDAHLKLHSLYRQIEYYDLALEHLTAAVDQAEARGPHKGEPREDYKARLEALKRELKNLDDAVSKRRNDFVLRTADRPLAEKVNRALSNGLAKKALELLVYADYSQIGVREASVQLELLLTMGRLDTLDEIPGVRERLQPDLKVGLGFNYNWYTVLLEAASGNYELAGRSLDEAIDVIEQSTTANVLRLLQAQTFQGDMRPLTLQGLSGLLEQVRQAAEFRVLRGMLALEEGDNHTAAKHFQKALDISNQGRFDFEGRVIAFRYLQLIKAAGGDR